MRRVLNFQHLANRVRHYQVYVFNLRHHFRWHIDVQLNAILEFAALKTRKADCNHSVLGRCFHRAQNVRRISAPAERDRDIAAFRERDERLGKDGVIAKVVRIRGEKR